MKIEIKVMSRSCDDLCLLLILYVSRFQIERCIAAYVVTLQFYLHLTHIQCSSLFTKNI